MWWGTVGLSNARSVLDDADVELGYRCGSSGTVNLVVATNALPTIRGRVRGDPHRRLGESRRISGTGATSRKTDRPADLTGTDCLVVGASGEVERGSLRSTYRAWRNDRPCRVYGGCP